MERVARVVPRLNVLIGLIGVVAGSIILVTCTSTGLLSKRNGKIAWGSAGLGFLVRTAEDLAQTCEKVWKRMASGQCTPSEAATMMSMLEQHRRVLETEQLLRR